MQYRVKGWLSEARVLVAKPDALNPIPKIPMVEGELIPKSWLCCPHVLHSVQTQINKYNLGKLR